MPRISTLRRASQAFLWVAPFISPVLMLAYRAGGLKLYALCGAALLLLIAGAVWILAADSVKTSTTNRRDALLPGVLLVASLSSVAVTVTSGPPPVSAAEWVATLSVQHLRYVGLLVAGLLAWAGFEAMTTMVQAAGERAYSVLARSATTVSMALFILFILGALTIFDVVAQQRNSGNTPTWVSPLLILMGSWASLYSVLTYLAVSLYAIALARTGMIGNLGRNVFVALGAIASILAVVATLMPNPSGTFTHGLFVLQVPAVPLILPYFIGVNLVRRAVDPVSN
jgi:hypothetical protein